MNYHKFITAIFIVFFMVSCEEVIDVNLDTASPRLVVEASINWDKETEGNQQFIKLTTTTAYFATSIPTVSGATVFITNSNNVVFDFIEDELPGIYECSTFLPVLNEIYTLTIVYNGETYTSTEKLLETPDIKRVEQKEDGGILGNDIEVKFFFDDIEDETNFYLEQIDNPYEILPQYSVTQDRFFQNSELFGLYFSEDLEPGDLLTFTLNGITQNSYNYLNILLAQTGSSNGGPFSTPAATVRGNVVNQTNFDNYALGYFRLSERVRVTYTIE